MRASEAPEALRVCRRVSHCAHVTLIFCFSHFNKLTHGLGGGGDGNCGGGLLIVSKQEVCQSQRCIIQEEMKTS